MFKANAIARTAVCAVLLLAAPAWADAQGGFPPKALTNLQVLPGTSTPADVIGTMKGFAQGLGVRCQHCHVGTEGQPLDTFDFSSDAPPKKHVARAMMRLVQTINAQLAQGAGGGEPPRVTCYTCHRGAERPTHAPG